jgi:hypothetical protein
MIEEHWHMCLNSSLRAPGTWCYIGKVARGNTIFMNAFIIGAIWVLAFSPVMLGVAIGWWAFQLYDLYRLIRYGKPLV